MSEITNPLQDIENGIEPRLLTGLTYDDVLLLPEVTDVIPAEVDTSTRFSREITLHIPLISAAMDTVTESRMAIAMARQGGMGILHRNLSIENQAQQVRQVKRSESGMVTDPVTIGPNATIEQLDELCAKYRVSGLPVVNDADAVDHRTHRHFSPRSHETAGGKSYRETTFD